MSTTFDVLPGSHYIPTFEEIVELSSSYLNSFLRSIGLKKDIGLRVNLHKSDESIINNNVQPLEAKWDSDYYAWFYIKGIDGGTDCHFSSFEESDYDIWKEEIKGNVKIRSYKNEINKSLKIGHYWSLRRSAGQPGVIALCYGLIAASLAKLTDGLIYTDDGAWDYSQFPTNADNFLTWYFRPEFTVDTDYKEWVQSCISSICKELQGK
ncbi:hypothetical protein ACHOLT_11635 [Desulfitobacterium sp. Sab5]|uniref:hypothetical protein n=1 Tax=Desulfitobacterium nosdiversum TaxID=3375356 RepID=UPI003CED0EC5